MSAAARGRAGKPAAHSLAGARCCRRRRAAAVGSRKTAWPLKSLHFIAQLCLCYLPAQSQKAPPPLSPLAPPHPLVRHQARPTWPSALPPSADHCATIDSAQWLSSTALHSAASEAPIKARRDGALHLTLGPSKQCAGHNLRSKQRFGSGRPTWSIGTDVYSLSPMLSQALLSM